MIFMTVWVYGAGTGTVIAKTKTDKGIDIQYADPVATGVDGAYLEGNTSQATLRVSNILPTEISILIDTSKSMGRSYRRGIKSLLQKWIPALEKNHASISLSTFDKNLKLVYRSSDHNLSKVLKRIRVKGQVTELWRSIKNALNQLAREKAKRKLLVVFSDGDYEDTEAYTSKDVIALAKKHHIRIAALGYNEKKTNLQNLRILAEETHGKIWIADKKHALKQSFMKEFDQLVASEFMIHIPTAALHPTFSSKQTLGIVLTHQGKKVQTLSVEVETSMMNLSFWEKYKLYLLIGTALILLLLIFWLLMPKKEEEIEVIEETMDESTIINEHTLIPEPLPEPTPTPVAWLESMGGAHHDIYRFPATIGKGSGNDVIIEGKYISRNHAVIDFKDGIFTITDRNSKNGTKVNGITIKEPTVITPGTKIELGPYKTIFVLK